MGEVIQVAFGTEREWQNTLRFTESALVTVGTIYGDDEHLMRAKAERVYRVLREIVEDMPELSVTVPLPGGLFDSEFDICKESIRQAAREGIECAMTHAVRVFMASIYDLCTSKLKEQA